MGMTFHIDIVSAAKKLYSGRAELLVATAAQGELGIIPGHAQLLTSLKPGQVRLRIPNQVEQEVFYISGGILEVQPHLVTVLADEAERAADLDQAKALEAEKQARALLAGKQGEVDYAVALKELAIAMAQLRAIRAAKKLTN